MIARLPDYSIFFQLETLTIQKTCVIVGENESSLEKIETDTDSQATFQSLSSSTVNSTVIRQLLNKLTIKKGRRSFILQ